MKKVLALILSLCLCIGVCGCEKSTDTSKETQLDYNPENYVGVWVKTNYDTYELDYNSFQLFSNGKGMIADTFNSDMTADEQYWGYACEWMVEGNQLIIFFERKSDNCAQALNFQIVSDTEIKLDGGIGSRIYTKK